MRVPNRDACTRSPRFDSHILVAVLEQESRRNSTLSESKLPSFARLAHGCRAIIRSELPEAHEDGAAIPGRRHMRSPWRIANIGTDRIVAMLVLKDAVEDEELLAAAVHVARERTAGRIADDRGGPSLLVADAKEHAPLDTRSRARNPCLLRRMDHNRPGKIIIDAHG